MRSLTFATAILAFSVTSFAQDKGTAPALPNQETMVVLSKKLDTANTVAETFGKWIIARQDFLTKADAMEKFACTADETKSHCSRRKGDAAEEFFNSYSAAMNAFDQTVQPMTDLLFERLKQWKTLSAGEKDTLDTYLDGFEFWASVQQRKTLDARGALIADKLAAEAVAEK